MHALKVDPSGEKGPLPCPFCEPRGHPYGLWLYERSAKGPMWVECSYCHEEGPKAKSRQGAINQWNKRVAPKPPEKT